MRHLFKGGLLSLSLFTLLAGPVSAFAAAGKTETYIVGGNYPNQVDVNYPKHGAVYAYGRLWLNKDNFVFNVYSAYGPAVFHIKMEYRCLNIRSLGDLRYRTELNRNIHLYGRKYKVSGLCDSKGGFAEGVLSIQRVS
jgi:hypothetical protein